ncbi:MAG: hypothetical protein ACP5IC_00585 [Minisyncoccia bacterium]
MEHKKNKNKIASIIILSFGLLISFIIILGANATNAQNKINNVDTNQINMGYFFATTTNNLITDSSNQTNQLINDYIGYLFNHNPQKIITKDANGNINVDISPTYSNYLTQKYLYQPLDYLKFTSNDIKTDPDISKNNQLKYIKSIITITQNAAVSMPTTRDAFSNLIENNDPSLIQKAINIISQEIDQTKNLSVPVNWSQFHIDLLNNWEHLIAIYTAVINKDSDPLKAVNALNDLEQRNIDRALDLATILVNQYNKLTK